MKDVQFHSQKFALAAIAVAIGFVFIPRVIAADARMVVAQTEKPAGEGVVNTIDTKGRMLNITHGPVAALKWPGMTMDFGLAPSVDLAGLQVGSKIGFTLTRGADGMLVIDSIKPAH